ncbi:MAG: acetyl-CoA C-acetyltransferase [Deltaproteobacteria bacterium]|nr:acetyl-CoA C-acetyltransferase [Deltaproteobacteria bacterium]
MSKAVIVSAARTAVGSFGGVFADKPAPELGGLAIAEAIRRAGIDPASVEEVILGNVLSANLGLNPARVAAIKGGVPKEVPSFGVNKACGSGLKAVALAAQSILLGEAECVVAGGMENMTLAPYLLAKARFGYRMGPEQIIDSMIADGLSCPLTFTHMGITAENIAAKYGITREAQDAFSVSSQQKTGAAQASGALDEEIFTIEIAQKKGDPVRVNKDEYPRPSTTVEALSKLRPAFKKDGTVTAGNASGINDGAAALVVMSEARAKAEKREILAVIRGAAAAGVDPAIMGMGPWPASEKVLARTGIKKEDIGLWELNEAFAAQSLGVLAELKIDPAKVNVNGGAVALGHPIGASGARILTTLLYAMKHRNVSLGLASLCIGGGQGISLIVERV